MQEVRVIISPDGETTVEVKGVKGKGCKALTNPFMQDADVLREALTAEYHAQAAAVAQAQPVGRK